MLTRVPEGLGYVVVDHPERYDNLPVPLKGYNHTTYTTSMTHQLHCLVRGRFLPSAPSPSPHHSR